MILLVSFVRAGFCGPLLVHSIQCIVLKLIIGNANDVKEWFPGIFLLILILLYN